MKKAKVLLDLPNDRVRIKGAWVELITSHCEHYGLYLLPKSSSMVVFEGLVAQDVLGIYSTEIPNLQPLSLPHLLEELDHPCIRAARNPKLTVGTVFAFSIYYP